QTLAANTPDSLVLHEAAQPVQQIGADIGGAFGQFLGFQDLDVANGNGRGDRVAAVGVDLPDLPVFRHIAVEALEYAVLHHRRGDRQVGTGDAFGDRECVGGDGRGLG